MNRENLKQVAFEMEIKKAKNFDNIKNGEKMKGLRRKGRHK